MADNDPVPPDLQEWIRRYGGYAKIDWKAWDHAYVEYQAERAALYLRERISRTKITGQPQERDEAQRERKKL